MQRWAAARGIRVVALSQPASGKPEIQAASAGVTSSTSGPGSSKNLKKIRIFLTRSVIASTLPVKVLVVSVASGAAGSAAASTVRLGHVVRQSCSLQP